MKIRTVAAGVGLLCAIFAGHGQVAFAQETTRSHGSFDFTSQGIVFATTDSVMSVIMRFRVQNWAEVRTKSDEDMSAAQTSMMVRRLRLRFGGYLYDPALRFNIQLSFAPNDIDVDDDLPAIIRDAMVFWDISKDLSLSFGQTKLPGNRQRVISSGDIQFADRSIVNSNFTLDRDMGFQLGYRHRLGDAQVNLRAALTTGEGRGLYTAGNDGFCYTGRVEVLPFGSFKNGGDYFEGDLERESTPKLSVGLTGSHNAKGLKARGQLGQLLAEPRSQTMVLSDALLKYNGFALYGEYARRIADDPITRNSSGTAIPVFVGQGFLAQASYIFPSNIELSMRWAQVDPEAEIEAVGAQNQRHATGMVMYYFRGHRAKVGMEFTHEARDRAGVESSSWIGRFNMELGI